MIFSILYKLANVFLLVMLALGFCVALRWRKREQRTWWLASVTVLYLILYVYSLPVTSYYLTGLLEWQLPRQLERPEGIDAIIVLGGGVVPSPGDGIPTRLADGSLWRCHRAEELYHAGPSVPVLVIGGNPDGQKGDDVADVMGKVLLQLGVNKSDLIVETKSENTRENARATKALLDERQLKRTILVTSALHLPRATRLFRQQGIDVLPVGCDYSTDHFEWGRFAFLPTARAAQTSSEACREWMSTLALWLSGK